MDSYDILVIILSITLAVFLVLAIIATVQIIKLLRKVHMVTDKAMQAVEDVEGIAANIKSATTSSVLGGVGVKMWNRFYKAQSKKN